METIAKKPRKRITKVIGVEVEVPEPIPANNPKTLVEPPRKRNATTAEREIVFITPPTTEQTPTKPPRKREVKKETTAPPVESAPATPNAKAEGPVKKLRQRKTKTDSSEKDFPVAVAPAPVEKAVNPSQRRKSASPMAKSEPVEQQKAPQPAKKKKATQASWDKWVKATVVSVGPDVWNVHTSELSHNSQFLTDLRKLPSRVLLDTPTLDYLFRCPDRLSHNARLVLNEEGIECVVSLESLREWADKMRTGHYLINKENGFFDKILDRFDLESVTTTTEVYQKYISLKAMPLVDISWERKPEDVISTRLDADERPTRIIAAQALVLGVTILSPDLRFEAYKKDGLKTVW